MKKTSETVSSMQVEVWRMKDKVFRDTKNMGSKDFFKYVANKSRKWIKQKDLSLV